jgi:hypothetical protein
MSRQRVLMGMLMFGSLWGLLECTLGAFLHLMHLPAGAVMTSIALGIMAYSRRIYGRKGMQLGMGFIASSFKLLNLGFIGGCIWCAMVAIIAEALIFEGMLSLPVIFRFYGRNKVSNRILSGAILGYTCYSGGYLITETITPLLTSTGFYLADLVSLTPLILLRGVTAAVLTAIAIPLTSMLTDFKISEINARTYYPLTSTVTVMCWIVGIVI